MIEFIKHLFINSNNSELDKHNLLIWAMDPTGKKKHSYYLNLADIEENPGKLETLISGIKDDYNVYFGLCTGPRAKSANQRYAKTEVNGIPGLWLDVDTPSEFHKNKALPGYTEVIELLDSCLNLQPSIVVNSGNGYHLYFVFDEFQYFDSKDDLQYFASLQANFNQLVRDILKSRGKDLDAVHDLSRVLRLPDTFNLKDPANKKTVSIESFDKDLLYNPKVIHEYLENYIETTDKTHIVKPDYSVSIRDNDLFSKIESDITGFQGEFSNQEWKEYNNIIALARENVDFDKIINHNMDFTDNSNSRYDYEIASVLIKSGIEYKYIAKAILEHRNKHADGNLKLGRAVCYYASTIHAAIENSGRKYVPISNNDSKEFISVNTGLSIDSIEKHGGIGGLYVFTLNDGQKFEVANSESLLAFHKFRISCYDGIRYIMPKEAKKEWDSVIGAITNLIIDVNNIDNDSESMLEIIKDYTGYPDFGKVIPADNMEMAIAEGQICKYKDKLYIRTDRLKSLIKIDPQFKSMKMHKINMILLNLGFDRCREQKRISGRVSSATFNVINMEYLERIIIEGV